MERSEGEFGVGDADAADFPNGRGECDARDGSGECATDGDCGGDGAILE